MGQPSSQIELAGELFRQGRYSAIRPLVESLMEQRISRDERATLANIARRAYGPDLVIRLLRKQVRGPKGTVKRGARPREITEYAAAIASLGGNAEAEQLFSLVSTSEYPEALLLRALALFAQWEYRRAIPLLEEYIRHSSTDENRIKGCFRLAAAYMRGARRYDDALKLLDEYLPGLDPSVHGPYLLNGSLLRIELLYFTTKNHDEALRGIQSLERIFPESGHTHLQIWKRLFAVKQRPDDRGVRAALDSLRERKPGQPEWRFARILDLYESALFGRTEMFEKAHFGTPYPAFRKRLSCLFERDIQLRASYDWTLGGATADTSARIDVMDGSSSITRGSLKPGQTLQRLLRILSSDFYRPLYLLEIHERLYPGEYFNPETSIPRVHVCMSRLRAWIQKSRLPLEIRCKADKYWLQAGRPLVLRVPNPDQELDASVPGGVQSLLPVIRRTFGSKEFTASSLATLTGGSCRNVQLQLKAARELGLITSIGKGPATRHRLSTRD